MAPPYPDFLARLQRIREGDEQVVEELVRSYYEAILRFVRFHLRRYPLLRRIFDAEDFTSETVLTMLGRIRGEHRLDSEREFVAVLRGIARNRVKKAAERYLDTATRDLRRQQPLTTCAAFLAAPTLDPAAAVIAHEQAEHALALRFQEQAILRMRDREGRSPPEVAGEPGRNARAAAQRMLQFLSLLCELGRASEMA